MEEKFVDLDKLIVCCQPLYGERISEMRNQIEYLRLRSNEKFQTFMAKHTLSRLRNLIKLHGSIINCGCPACLVTQAFSSPRTGSKIPENPCRWQPAFEGMIMECGMSSSAGNFLIGEGIHGHVKTDADAHFCSGLRGDWVSFVDFGKKFWPSSTYDASSEFRKYTLFVKKIYVELKRWRRNHDQDDENPEDDLQEFNIDSFYEELEDPKLHTYIQEIMNPLNLGADRLRTSV